MSSRRVPADVASAINAAFELEQRGDFSRAIALLRRALAQHPEESEIKWRLSLMLLREGNFEEGWPLFEARPVQMGGRAPGKPTLNIPEWDGRPVDSLVILPEQGLGDQIMFARYAPHLSSKGVDVTVVCHPVLERLFGRLGTRVIPATGKVHLPKSDAWILGPSLPHRARCIPSAPYLLGSPGGKGIGFLGQGNPAHVNDAIRSLPPHFAAEITSWPGVQSLAREAIDANDLEDTAKAIDKLALVISVDTAVAHVAGAMGKPCWLLLPHVPDWRWLRQRCDSPWYPSMRIFRQSSRGDWDSVMVDLRTAYSKFSSGD